MFDGHANSPDLITTQYTHVSKYYATPHKYIVYQKFKKEE
jgi:hypothetical protein